jgi:nicotinate-nucleotide adenylyltransferase
VRGLEKAFHARILRLPVRNIEISSTDLRERVREGKSLRYLAPPAVEAYIREKRLYLEEGTPDTSRE